MKQTKLFKILSFVLAFMLIAAMALFGAGCNDNTTTEPSSITESGSETSANQNVLGEGKTSFTLNITFKDGSEKTYTINTNKTIVGEALTELGLISGTVGDYGLMVETVDGETVKFEDDGKYWAFYINGEYAMSGVDTTDITAGASYALKVE